VTPLVIAFLTSRFLIQVYAVALLNLSQVVVASFCFIHIYTPYPTILVVVPYLAVVVSVIIGIWHFDVKLNAAQQLIVFECTDCNLKASTYHYSRVHSCFVLSVQC